MKPVRALYALALPALIAGTVSAQAGPFLGNTVQPSAGGLNVFLYNNPSIGGPVGMPDPTGDLAYKGVPQNRTVSLDTFGVPTGLNIISLEENFLGYVDWPSGPPDIFDVGIATSTAENGVPTDNLVPDFFTTNSLTAVLSFGNSGFPHPCVAAPSSTCTNSTQCPPLISGFVFDVDIPLIFGVSGIGALSGADDLRGNHLVTFLPPNMVFGATSGVGLCGTGDYVFMGAQSPNEAQADVTTVAGRSICEGFQLGDPAGISPTGPIADMRANMLEMRFGFEENVVEAEVTDNGAATPYGPVRGGASLAVDTSTGTASLAPRCTFGPQYVGSLCFPVASLTPLPVAVPVFGASLMVSPDGTFNSTFSAWAGTGAMLPLDKNGDMVADAAEAIGLSLPLPVIAGRGYLQAFAITGFGPITADASTVWTFDLR